MVRRPGQAKLLRVLQDSVFVIGADKRIRQEFPGGWKARNAYLRIVPQPTARGMARSSPSEYPGMLPTG